MGFFEAPPYGLETHPASPHKREALCGAICSLNEPVRSICSFGFSAFGQVTKPGDTHSYQSVAPHTEFFGVVAPGGWERFFHEAGEVYDGVIFPEPGRPFDFRRMGPAMAKFDVHPTPEVAFAALPAQSQDHALPTGLSSYFLEAGYGQKRLLGGHLITAILTAPQSEGSLELHEFAAPRGARIPACVTAHAPRFLHVLDGELQIELKRCYAPSASGRQRLRAARHGPGQLRVGLSSALAPGQHR